jgi:antirestriction protein ArdC
MPEPLALPNLSTAKIPASEPPWKELVNSVEGAAGLFLNAHVCAGARGHHIVFVKDVAKRSDEGEGEPHRFQMLKSYTVFNIAQCADMLDRLTAPPKPPNPDQRHALIDEFIVATGVELHETDGDEAYYAGGDADFIAMPAFKFFRGRAHFCVTLFHELVHATGQLDKFLKDEKHRV